MFWLHAKNYIPTYLKERKKTFDIDVTTLLIAVTDLYDTRSLRNFL